jgi:hypothetical protein
MNIIECVDDENLFAPFFRNKRSWSAWRVFLKALYGLPLDEHEAEIFRQFTGRTILPNTPYTEAFLVCGRRAGKSRILALLAVYITCFKDWRPYLSPGEGGYLVIVAADRKQAKTIMGYIRAFINETPMLKARIVRETQEELEHF